MIAEQIESQLAKLNAAGGRRTHPQSSNQPTSSSPAHLSHPASTPSYTPSYTPSTNGPPWTCVSCTLLNDSGAQV
eukprot:2492537-Pyramimonas_sp.AAC.1